MNFAMIKGAAMTAGRFVVKHKGVILSGMATVGVLATAYFAYKESDEAKERLAKAEVEKGAPLTKVETIKTAAPAMKKTLFATGMTIAVIWGSRFLDEKDKKELRETIRDIREEYRTFRDLNDKESTDKTLQEMADKKNPLPTASDDNIVYKIYDQTNKFGFEATLQQVKIGWAAMNKEFITKGRTTFATFYKAIGVTAPAAVDELGWDKDVMPKHYYETYGRDFLWIDYELTHNPSRWSDYEWEMCAVEGPFFVVDRQPGHHWRNNK